jgi:Fe-S cluster assembly protein SufD
VQVLSLVRGGSAPFVAPRVLVVAEDGAAVQVIERAFVVDGGDAFLTPLTEVSVAQGANVAHFRIQDAGVETYEVSNTEAHQHRDSVFSATTITLSGATVRNNARVVLGGEHAESHLYGLFLGEGTMHVDNATEMDHAQPHCTSNELYKGVLDGRSKGVFNGRVMVRPDAQKTNAYQSSRAVVLSEGAEMNSKPELEIYADDVKCSHGAATGRLDEAALFYLRQRGLTPTQARALLLLAFAREVTDTITIPALHDWLDDRLQARFHTI